jgi:pimeloyl-ACP methyl ester carboxylesterase
MSNHAYRTQASRAGIFACCLVVLIAMDGRAQLITGKVSVGTRGHELYYEVQGTGEPVVLIHGLTLDLREWDAQVEALAERYQVIRYDVVGHGRSSGLSSALANGLVRDWDYLRDLLDELGVDKAHVVGLSMGGEIAINFALQHPERVQTLTPIDARLGGYNVPSELGNRFNSYINVSSTQGVQAALPLWTADPLFAPANANPEVRAKLEQIVVQGHGALGAGAMFQWPNLQKIAGLSAIRRLNEIDHPTLVMIGELDLIDFQLQADILDRDIRNSSKLVVPNAGHMSDMEQPAFVNAALLDFFAAHPISMPVPSDFSGDGVVDAADYVMWRKGLGTDYTQNDYDVWRAHFGETADGGSAGYPLGASAQSPPAVPEPSAFLLAAMALINLFPWRRKSGNLPRP